MLFIIAIECFDIQFYVIGNDMNGCPLHQVGENFHTDASKLYAAYCVALSFSVTL